MAIAVVLTLLVIGSVLFNFFSGWTFTPVASNWGSIDTIVIITLAITGVVTLLIAAFMIYAIVKYRTRDGHRAIFQAEDKKLEWWLIGLSSIGIIGMLAPGLVVYDDYVTVPDDAHEFEAVGQQWSWTYRYPGEDGIFGTSQPRYINGQNPLGLNPDDPNGQDDKIVLSNEVYVPVDKPVKALLRSVDVLHDFYVPQIRAKMDLVPGIVSWFWFTPTVPGRYEVLCAELCGSGHYNMRGHMVIAEQEEFDAWLDALPTFTEVLTMGSTGGPVQRGEALARGQGCIACHSVDGTPSLAPGWQNIFGKTETLTDGSTVVVDEAYFIESILEPNAKMVAGYPPVMIAYDFSDDQLNALVAYAKSLGEEGTSSDAEAEDSETSAAEEAMPADASDAAVDETETSADAEAPAASDTDQTGAQDPVAAGAELAAAKGCNACHSNDGSRGIGPSFKDLYGAERTFADGSSGIADDAYLRESIQNPTAKVVETYPPAMPPLPAEEAELDALVAYIKSNSSLSVEGE